MRLTFDDLGCDRPLGIAEDDPLPPDDRTLMGSSQPKLSLDALYRIHAPRLIRFFARRADRQDAGDLVQESFARLAGANISPEQPEAYLNQIAANQHSRVVR